MDRRYVIYEKQGQIATITLNRPEKLNALPFGYISHTLFTNLRYEPGEWNYFKERREAGAKAAFHHWDQLFDEAGKEG